MTTSAFATVQAGIIAALMQAPALAGGNIVANRQRPIPAGQSSAIAVRLDQAEATEAVLGCLSWQTAYSVECYARAATGTDPAAAVDPLLLDVWARLAALSDAALGATIAVQPRVDWQYDDAETPTCCAVIRITATHFTELATLQPRA